MYWILLDCESHYYSLQPLTYCIRRHVSLSFPAVRIWMSIEGIYILWSSIFKYDI